FFFSGGGFCGAGGAGDFFAGAFPPPPAAPPPPEKVFGLYKTESKRDFVREYVFLKFIQIILLRFGKKTFERILYF
ncbi:hypothetical protein, partial [Aedoeadaptatus coxii]|uniref:hypothetical protein n=1 Tax=Aedoeadaptatus coxii TaxID=755172 RepID=UPI002AD3FF5E